MNARTLLTAAVVTALALALAPVSADEPADIPPTIDSVVAARDGDLLTVDGAVHWGAQAPVLVGEDFGEDPPGGDAGRQAGVDLKEIYIHQPDGNADELVFTWQLAELNAAPPPEFVRYLWQLRVDGTVYWLQAKTSDLTTATMVLDDTPGHLTTLNGSFRLRGDCGPLADGAPVNTCGHVAWLDGVFDTEANQVRVTVPLDLEDAPHFSAGRAIDNEAQGAEAGFQAAISNANTMKNVAMEWTYRVPTKSVDLALFDGDALVAEGPGSIDGTGFAGELDVAGLSGAHTLAVTTCFAGLCTTEDVELSL